MKAAFMTLGCKVNQYETRKLMKEFLSVGFNIVSFSEPADVYVVNTCTVTGIADRKSRKMLHRAKRANPEAVVAAMGCYVTADIENMLRNNVADIVISNEKKDEAFEIIINYLNSRHYNCSENESAWQNCKEGLYNETVSHHDICNEHTRAYIKVQDGCNQFCTYCKIPYVRGRLKSRDKADIITEITELCQAGYKEVVITGIHLSSYGVDKTDASSFIELSGKPLYELLCGVAQIKGLERIRLGSLEPRIITDEFAENISKISVLCPHFHLSLQSGCDETLMRMKRRYNTTEYKNAVSTLRKYYDNPSITTDVIVGFPGETDEEFEKTLRYVKDIRFSMVHVFKYSRRTGTKADLMENQIDEKIKNNRSGIMLEAVSELTEEYAMSFIGQKQRCLIEEIISIKGIPYYVGHNERYMRVAIPASDLKNDLINEIIEATPVEYIGDDILLGKL